MAWKNSPSCNGDSGHTSATGTGLVCWIRANSAGPTAASTEGGSVGCSPGTAAWCWVSASSAASAAIFAGVRPVNTAAGPTIRPARRALVHTLIEEIESPPRAKKSSSGPHPGSPSTSANAVHSTRSSWFAGSRAGPACVATGAGAGSAARSNLPLGVSGSSSSTTSAAGTIGSGKASASATRNAAGSTSASAAGTR